MQDHSSSSKTILDKILARKWEEVAERQQFVSMSKLKEKCDQMPPTRGFAKALATQISHKRPAVIAEIKKASPSKGLIRTDFDPRAIAVSYAKYGATCLSVLTDHDFFSGHEDYLKLAQDACHLPVIRKDFMVDEWQIYESRALGADCILLIVAALTPQKLQSMAELAAELGMDVLIEVHDKKELQLALSLKPNLVGINNRDLHTFKTSLQTTIDLLSMIPAGVSVITESGINTKQEVRDMLKNGVYGFLVGESFMRAKNPGSKLQELFFHG
jgi:indole-3-glycerol phosphate synthase